MRRPRAARRALESSMKTTMKQEALIQHLGLRVAFGALRPKPLHDLPLRGRAPGVFRGLGRLALMLSGVAVPACTETEPDSPLTWEVCGCPPPDNGNQGRDLLGTRVSRCEGGVPFEV